MARTSSSSMVYFGSALQLSESSDGHFSFNNARNVEILVSIDTADHNQAMVLVSKKLVECLLRSQPFQGKKESFSKFEVHFVIYFRLSAFGFRPNGILHSK